MVRPPRVPRSRCNALAAGSFLLLASCATAAAPRPPAPARAGEAPLERCTTAPAAATRCGDATAALGGIVPGSALRGGRVTEVAVAGGHVVLSLTADDGAVVGVDVVRADPADPAPPVRAGALALYLRSDAPGAPTPAWQLALVQALADAIPRDAAAPAWLARLGQPPPR